jgi:hypothetical protein
MLRLTHPKKKKEIPKAVAMEAALNDFLRLPTTTRVHKLEGRLYKVFLEMHALLENYAPLWYFEALRRRAKAIIRECSPRATSVIRQTSRSSRSPTHAVH